MEALRLSVLLIAMAAATACSYDGVRLTERHKCASMPQTLAERCYSRNSLTKAEYDAKRAEVRRSSATPSSREDKPVDPRYEQWIP